MSLYEGKKYYTDSKNLENTLNEYGVAIIPSVLNEKECEHMINGIWDYFEYITHEWDNPIKKDSPNSYREIYKLYPMHSMLIQHWKVGHSQVVWNLRQNEKIVDIFSKFWECPKEDLLVSFDGLSFNLPPENTNRGCFRKAWFHTDQSYTRNSLECIQSWVTALDVNEGDATLSFLEGSHHLHEDCRKAFDIKDKSDWYKLDDIEEQFYIDCECIPKRIKCPKGSIVFWDSRTIHCGSEAIKGRKKENMRGIVYLCYMPRELCSENDLKKKRKAFEEMRMTSHWPSKPKLFSKMPRTYGGEIQKISDIPKPILTNLGKKLAGF